MPELQNGRVAVYLDFDNIVLSWYDRVHGRNSFSRDRARIAEDPTDPEMAARLKEGTIDVGAIIDYASSFGTLVLTRAYADWSAPVNADYRTQLVARAVDLVQLFPAAAYAKNGADIRLAVDAVEDMFRLEDLTHVIIVAGDSDYVPLAQRCKRLGRYVVGVGVAGSTAKSLTAACDEFASYDALPGVTLPAGRDRAESRGRRGQESEAGSKAAAAESATTSISSDEPAGSGRGSRRAALSAGASAAEAGEVSTPGTATAAARSEDASVPADAAQQSTEENSTAARGRRGRGSSRKRAPEAPAHGLSDADSGPQPISDPGTDEPEELEETAEDREIAVTGLLIRALWLGQEKDDSGWLHSSAVKQQMRRMDPSFNEKALGFRSFSDFLKSRSEIAELEETGHERLVRLREQPN